MINLLPDTSIDRRIKGRQPRRRTGAVLAIVVMALLVVMLLGAAICQTFLSEQQSYRLRESRLQTLWILESAAQRGIRRRTSDEAYRGETWDIPADDLDGVHPGRAVIRVEEVTEPQDRQRLIIEVQYPADAVQRVVFQRELFTVSPGSGGSS